MAGINELVAKIAEDEELQAKIASVENIDELVKVVKEVGFDVSKEELVEYVQPKQESGELSDDDLDDVVGGAFNVPTLNVVIPGKLFLKKIMGMTLPKNKTTPKAKEPIKATGAIYVSGGPDEGKAATNLIYNNKITPGGDTGTFI